MNEKNFTTASGASVAAPIVPAVRPVAVSSPVAAVPLASAPVVQPVAAQPQPPSAFGGHKGGGKKRADGLIAGSAEAIAADKLKDAARKKSGRAEKMLAALPPPLPGVAVSGAGAAAALPVGESPVPAAVAGAPINPAGAVLPMFVPWSEKLVGRLAKIGTKILDRLRVGSVMKRVRKLGLGKELETEAEKRIAYKEEQVADFNAALTNCLVIEGNKRRVPGAEHGHWLELGLVGGELVNCHLDTVDWLEKAIIAKGIAEKLPEEEKK